MSVKNEVSSNTSKPALNLLVLRSSDLEKSVGFYNLLGLSFVEEKHDSGPKHYSSQIGQLVFELYPLGEKDPTHHIRLGFVFDSVDETLLWLESESIVHSAEDTDRGRLAVVNDPDGHIIELLQISREQS